ncbi:helix-turn-helix domain-containing protein [Nocardioides sp. BP30]|uniref:helix-turn-helix domain-containing protein n=1 Tax=Nocardioides sp. BP30 TaxID=3036374 RepID=UPI002469B8AC|nr:helix-turn-helix domain-containing protein [Nocardioides sp. BP30]WGL52209.1 helix-turn-helix domain-containing protein [Nocardioides sp. BP30]
MVRIPQARAYEVDQDVDQWEEHNARSLIELACVVDDAPFRARQVNLQLEQLHLARVTATAHRVSRDRTVIARRPADAIAVYVGLRGDSLLEYDGGRRVVHPGQLLVCDVDRPFVRGFGHGLHELAVKVPRAAFEAHAGTASLTSPLVLEARDRDDDPYARALARLVGRAVAAAVPVPADEQAVLELVAVLATGGRRSSPLAHRAAARAFIDDHLSDPGLSATAVAAGAGISERHLSRLFADAGTSVPRHILARRLDLAHSMLTHDVGGHVRIVDIAGQCGFTSMAHFSQAFRRRFDATPGEVRLGGGVGPA